jgi:hypothetical protein
MILGWWLACSGPNSDTCPDETTCATEDCGDCSVVGSISDLGETECTACQGVACDGDAPPAGCERLPCVEGAVVLRGCECDADCADVGLLCGLHATAYQGICTTSDDF